MQPFIPKTYKEYITYPNLFQLETKLTLFFSLSMELT